MNSLENVDRKLPNHWPLELIMFEG
jgi:hypothetical protein